MDEARENQLKEIIGGMWQQMESYWSQTEDTIPAASAEEDRLALARRIGRLYLSFARVIIDRVGEEDGRDAILEAIRDYSARCSDARKKGIPDLPRRGIHTKTEVVEVDGQKRLRCYGCGISDEFAAQDENKLGALYCYIDPCSFMMTLPNIKLFHTKMEPLGDDCCEFDLATVSDEEMQTVLEQGRDYQDVDPIIKERTQGDLLKNK